MVESFVQGLILGFGVSVPFGPVNILILTAALKSFRNALAVGIGAMSVDVLYLVFLSFGVLNFLQNESLEQILAIFGFCFLSFVAFLMIRKKPNNLNLNEENKNESVLKSFFKGFFLNLLNPYIIGFWLSMSLLILQNSSPFLMLLALILAILVWIFSLSFVVARLRHLITPKILFVINLISALIIEYFAIVLLIKVFF